VPAGSELRTAVDYPVPVTSTGEAPTSSKEVDPTETAKEVAEGFRKTLNSHGHSFQRAVWKTINEMQEGDQRNWRRLVYEFPVSFKGRSTSIDLILRRTGWPFFLVVECKRANPALARWCFARGPTGTGPENELVYEALVRETGEAAIRRKRAARVYSLAMEVRTGEKGESDNQGRGRIEEAVTQAFRGVGGLLERFSIPELLTMWGTNPASEDQVIVFPAVVTTASLWVTEIDLGAAGLTDGNLVPGTLSVTRVPWLFYRYRLTPDLRTKFGPAGRAESLQEILGRDFGRTVAIVGADGLGDFLATGIDEF
jgi:hypothetical protein